MYNVNCKHFFSMTILKKKILFLIEVNLGVYNKRTFGMKSFSRIVAIPKNFQMMYISIKIQNKQIPSAHSTSIAATFPFDSHRTLLGSGLEVLGSFFLAAEVVDFLAVGLLTCPSAGAPKLKKNVSYVN